MVAPVQRANSTSRDDLLAALILAFKHSKLKATAGSNAFASLLDEQWESIVAPGTDVMKLQVVFDLLKHQGGFDLDSAVPPLARIKTWEPYLRIRVDLPKELVQRGVAPNPELHARPCAVPQAELVKTLPAAAASLTLNSSTRANIIRPAEKEPPKLDHRKARLAVVATVLILVGAAGGGAAYMQLRVTQVDVNTVSDSIPLQAAQRQGKTLTATIKDRSWLSFSKDDRKLAVRETFAKISGMGGITELRIVDDQGATLATVKSTGKPEPVIEMLQ